MKVLVFDNYDSFTYNLVHMAEAILHTKADVFRNDEIDLADVNKYDKIILSPGPGIPSEAGLLIPLIKAYAASKSILGVCLGHQAIGEAFGGQLENLQTVYHGITTQCHVTSQRSKLFSGLPLSFEIGRYHSWIVSDQHFPGELEITARDDNGFNMAMQHKTYDLQSVQFHPESVLTPLGLQIMENWLRS
jgi:anthranilate synthase component II